MSGCNGSACCLALLEENDSEVIVGVAVLLRNERRALGVVAGGYELWSDPSFVLGKSGRALREPKIPLRASVVFAFSCPRQRSKKHNEVSFTFVSCDLGKLELSVLNLDKVNKATLANFWIKSKYFKCELRTTRIFRNISYSNYIFFSFVCDKVFERVILSKYLKV